VLGIILGGGAGTRLYPLTKKRAKPAVPLGANYRLIDIPVSNCVNSNVTKIYCLTQFNSASLNRHLSQAYVSDGGGVCERVGNCGVGWWGWKGLHRGKPADCSAVQPVLLAPAGAQQPCLSKPEPMLCS
jgi:NDP-sugar pyrophosphorylase family protein